MARMRTVKPEFWTDPVIVTLSPWARLLYIGMWGHADEWGVLKDEPMRLKLQVLPADDVDIVALIDELAQAGRVARMTTTEGASVLVVPRFRDHQKTDPRLTPKWGDPQTFTPTNSDMLVRSDAQSSLSTELEGNVDSTRSNKSSRRDVTGSPSTSRAGKTVADQRTPTNTDMEVFVGRGQGVGVRGQGVGVRVKPPSTDVDIAVDPGPEFALFWHGYPMRNGKREGKAKGAAVWARMSPADRKDALVAVDHYAAACTAGLSKAADAFRWLRDRRWTDWQTPATPDPQPARAPSPRDARLAELVAEGWPTQQPELGAGP